MSSETSPVEMFAQALHATADEVEAGRIPGIRRRDSKTIARISREDADLAEWLLQPSWEALRIELAEERGEALLWRAVVIDLCRAYDIPDIGEHLEDNGLFGCADCGGVPQLGDGAEFCHHCAAAAEAEALDVAAPAKPMSQEWRDAAMSACRAGHWADGLAAAFAAAHREAEEIAAHLLAGEAGNVQ